MDGVATVYDPAVQHILDALTILQKDNTKENFWDIEDDAVDIMANYGVIDFRAEAATLGTLMGDDIILGMIIITTAEFKIIMQQSLSFDEATLKVGFDWIIRAPTSGTIVEAAERLTPFFEALVIYMGGMDI